MRNVTADAPFESDKMVNYGNNKVMITLIIKSRFGSLKVYTLGNCSRQNCLIHPNNLTQLTKLKFRFFSFVLSDNDDFLNTA